jgi:hypothetical protein
MTEVFAVLQRLLLEQEAVRVTKVVEVVEDERDLEPMGRAQQLVEVHEQQPAAVIPVEPVGVHSGMAGTMHHRGRFVHGADPPHTADVVRQRIVEVLIASNDE